MSFYKLPLCLFLFFLFVFTQITIAQNLFEDSIGIKKDSLSVSLLMATQHSSRDINPFWLYANRNGRYDRETSFISILEADYNRTLDSNHKVSVGAGIAYNNGVNPTIFIDQLYFIYEYKKIGVDLGIKHRPLLFNDLSSVGGDILWSRNARAIPGINLITIHPIKIANRIYFRANFAHYELFDNRVVERPKIHHKSLFFDIKVKSNQKLTLGLAHYVQWGGTSPEFGNQNITFKDFAKIILGGSGGNTRNDQINTLGNHIGSYRLNYSIEKKDLTVQFYHQSLFEDRSGRELNNFPDGVWGLFLAPKNKKFLNGILYEYVQTVSQSGRPTAVEAENQQSGGDNYFNNTVYRSGWTYFGQTIGLPFLTPSNTNTGIIQNRSIVHHLGISGNIWKLQYLIKGTYEKRLGNYSNPLIPSQKAIYSFLDIYYPTNFGTFNATFGMDYNSSLKENIGFGLGYRYTIRNN